MTDVQDILRSLGITRCYKGFKHTEYAVLLAVQNESHLEAVTNLYHILCFFAFPY